MDWQNYKLTMHAHHIKNMKIYTYPKDYPENQYTRKDLINDILAGVAFLGLMYSLIVLYVVLTV